MKQIETDPKYLAGEGAVAAMRAAESSDSSGPFAPAWCPDEDAFFRAQCMRDEHHRQKDYRLSVYASREDGSPVRVFPGAHGAMRWQSDGVVYPFNSHESAGGVMNVLFFAPGDGDDGKWFIACNSGDFLRGMRVVSLCEPPDGKVVVQKGTSCGPTEGIHYPTVPPKRIEDCPASADQRKPPPPVTVCKGGELEEASVEQGCIIELTEGKSTCRFKIAREVEDDEMESFGGWYIHEELSHRASNDWSLMDTLGEFASPGGAVRHLIANGYGIPLTALDPLGDNFHLAPGAN